MPNFIDLTGKKYERLTVIKRVEDKISNNGRHRSQWLCVCECGNEIVALSDNLRKGNTKSCGCYQKDIMRKIKTTHNDTDSRLYNVWCAIKRRCLNQSDPNYHRYGGRGITMCDEWKTDYSAFKKWAINTGYDENAERGQCTIDRINNDDGYYPSNCRWVTQKDQMNNVSYNHYLTHNGETHTMAEWSAITGIPYYLIVERINVYGYDVAKALKPISR